MNRHLEDEMRTKYEHAVNASEGKRAKTKTRISFGLIADDLDLVESTYFRN